MVLHIQIHARLYACYWLLELDGQWVNLWSAGSEMLTHTMSYPKAVGIRVISAIPTFTYFPNPHEIQSLTYLPQLLAFLTGSEQGAVFLEDHSLDRDE